MTLSFICWLNLLSARPSKEPTKFNLSTEKGNVKNIIPTSRLEQGEVKFCIIIKFIHENTYYIFVK